MILEKIGFFTLAAVLVVGAFTNRISYFGRMGGGSSGRRMPAWLARLIMLVIALMFAWYALKGQAPTQ